MELHENLYELGLTSGRGVFDDADLLRAALDDYLDEAAASTGDINLLVDAVRLGAFRMMQSTIDSGAEPTRAVESAGDMLARDRGTSDVTAARWACAVLGFAVGKVSATDVRRFDRTVTQPRPPAFPPPATQQPPAAPTQVGGWPVQSPSGPPPSSPPPGSPPTSRPTGQPTSWPPAAPPAAPQPYAGGYAPAYPSGPTGPPPPSRSRLPLVLGAVAAVVVIAVIGGLVAVLGGDDDTTETATDTPTSSLTPPTPPTPPTSSSAPTESPETSSPTPVPTIPPNPLIGSGYAFSLPEAWTDITEEILSGGDSGATDKAIAWGQNFDGARANLIIETGFAGGETDPEVIRPTWENNMVGATGATPVDNGDTTIDGEKAVSVKISRVNENGVAIEQFGYLTIHDGDLYSIILSTQEGDQKAQDTYDAIVDSWTWQ